VRRTLLVATRNAGKVAELAPLAAAAGFDVRSLDDARIAVDPREDDLEAFDTFEENAQAKARWFAGRVPGTLVLADDSGLEVSALPGRLGVRSKRWAGHALEGQALDDANNAALVAALRDAADRGARYVCVAAVCDGERAWVARGETGGTILAAPRGTNGFGYDPYFRSDELGITFAEATREQKAAVSHRGRAVRAVLELLRQNNRANG